MWQVLQESYSIFFGKYIVALVFRWFVYETLEIHIRYRIMSNKFFSNGIIRYNAILV